MTEVKQLQQVNHILNTLLEATDHLMLLIKESNSTHSFYMFSSIVEGTQAIFNTLEQHDPIFSDQSNQVVQYLTMIAEQLEKNNYTKVLEVIQFSLRPSYVQMQEQLNEVLPKHKEKISIGIYHRTHQPQEIIPKERLKATLNEAAKQGVNVYFFTLDNVDFSKQTINAIVFENKTWVPITIPYPDVISNIGVGQFNKEERQLQRIIPFTNTSYVGNKFSLPKKILHNRKYAELLVPFTVCVSKDKITSFLHQNEHVVFKALDSNRGENIYFVRKKRARYIILDQIKERILSEEEFQSFLNNVILAEKGSYIIQRYVHTRTKEDEPYHFRSHVQKNHEGKWQITHIYPRIGNKRSNLSNISTEGRVEDFSTFLRKQFGEKEGSRYEEEILRLSLDVTQHLDKLYGLSLNELGLDFAIDDTGRIWLHEANNGPQTAYHEEKRAIEYIGYATYIAKNGMMHQTSDDKKRIAKGAFVAKQSALPIVEINNNEKWIGVLITKYTKLSLLEAFARTAIKRNIHIFTFTPLDVDGDFELIRGSFYINNTWVQKITPYPSIIIDLVKGRNKKKQPIVYEELSEIVFTNEWDKHATTRSQMLIQLKEQFSSNILPFHLVKKPLHVFKCLEQTDSVLLKPNKLHSNYEHFDITYEHASRRYTITNEKGTVKTYTENALRHYLKYLIEKETYIIQENANSEDILHSSFITAVRVDKINWKLLSNDNALQGCERKVSSIASAIETAFQTNLSELKIEYTILKNGDVIIHEVNPSGPAIIDDEIKYAELMLTYANNI
ncbi:YheC/YheD family protein [Pseudogracilibacillus sp. ICA-222130]|uniref:YheC/YheD family protein n=1 Tax=Pseudogracilibacillus sp. ICA-222130 TaxID=3134655 RepID=UPI0030BEB3C4